MNRLFAAAALLVVFLLSTGCSHQINAAVEPGVDMSRVRSYYVVRPEASDVVTAIENDLKGRGFAVTTGPESSTPATADCKVIAHDKWMWDITMYLLEVKIDMVDARTGALLALGRCYRTSTVRKSPKLMVKEITDKIFAPAAPAVASAQ